MLTFDELCEKLTNEVDEITLLEVLGITTEDIVNRFQDRIESRWTSLLELVENPEDYVMMSAGDDGDDLYGGGDDDVS